MIGTKPARWPLMEPIVQSKSPLLSAVDGSATSFTARAYGMRLVSAYKQSISCGLMARIRQDNGMTCVSSDTDWNNYCFRMRWSRRMQVIGETRNVGYLAIVFQTPTVGLKQEQEQGMNQSMVVLKYLMCWRQNFAVMIYGNINTAFCLCCSHSTCFQQQRTPVASPLLIVI